MDKNKLIDILEKAKSRISGFEYSFVRDNLIKIDFNDVVNGDEYDIMTRVYDRDSLKYILDDTDLNYGIKKDDDGTEYLIIREPTTTPQKHIHLIKKMMNFKFPGTLGEIKEVRPNMVGFEITDFNGPKMTDVSIMLGKVLQQSGLRYYIDFDLSSLPQYPGWILLRYYK